MKFTIVFTTLLCVSTSWAVLAKKGEEPKDKREAPVGYASSIPSHGYQTPLGHGDASAISIGAGYSIGGAKPSYSFGGQGSSGALQLQQSESLSPNGHATIQLAPITLQGNHGGSFAAGDISQIMSQLTHSLNAGGLSLQPSTAVAEFHQSGDASQAGQELSLPQYTYSAPKLQQYTLPESLSNAPTYSSGTKGLGTYSTGPVLFSPESAQQSAAPAYNYGTQSSGQALDASSLSLGGSGHALSGLSFGGAGAGNSFGGSYKQLSGAYAAPSKSTFKPSTFIGSSVQGDSGHGGSLPSSSYSAPSFGGYRGASSGLSLGSASHGASFGGSLGGFGSGSSKYAASLYQPSKGEGFGSSLEGLSSLSSAHSASPPGTTYGFPTASYPANNAHAASSTKPYYVTTKHLHHASPSSFGEGSSAYRGPVSGHSSLSSYASGPKYSFGGSSSHYLPKDAQGAYSENSYNTIKYSEELKPRIH